MSNMYHVLWIDDEWESMTSFIKFCKLHYNIELKAFKTQKEGLDEYAKQPTIWEAVILDAKVLDKDENEAAEIGNLQKAVLRIKSDFKDLPYFIFTGQPDLMSNTTFKSIYPVYYGKATDNDRMCNDIIRRIQDSPNRKIIDKHPELFNWLRDSSVYAEVLEILKIQESNDNKNANVFNMIRKVLDWMMSELSTYGLLAINLTGTNLNDCSRFLCKKELQEIVPIYIQRHIYSCCSISNEGSHRLVIDEDVKTGKAPYLVQSSIFELISILSWMRQLPIDDETRRKITNIAVNVAITVSEETAPKDDEVSMQPEFDSQYNVWHCGDTMISLKSWEGGKVVLYDFQPNTSKIVAIKEKYPKYAKYKKN